MKYFKYILIVLLFFLSACLTNNGDIFLFNNSRQLIKSVTIKICAKSFEVYDIKPSAKIKISYKVTSDCDFGVIVLFDSGQKLEKRVGYITNGFSYEHEIKITDSDIVLVSSKIK